MPLEKRMNALHVDLKVCEGCGALWLRAGALDGVYCRACRAMLGQFPAARGRRAPLGPRRRRMGLHAVNDTRTATAVTGGAR
jgi:hypothetical protein